MSEETFENEAAVAESAVGAGEAAAPEVPVAEVAAPETAATPEAGAAEQTAEAEGAAPEGTATPETAASETAESAAPEPAPLPLAVVLASGSPRRHQLLSEAGVKHVVRLPQTPVDETLEPDQLADPAEACKKLAERKAGAVVQELLAENPVGMFAVIGADTMVVKDGQIFGKPANLSDGKHMLRQLSGATHSVITAVSLWLISAPDAEKLSMGFRTFADESLVTFKPLTDEEIADYLRKGESFDKAGAYAIQGEGRHLVSSVQGAMDTVIGLPAKKLVEQFPDLLQAK